MKELMIKTLIPFLLFLFIAFSLIFIQEPVALAITAVLFLSLLTWLTSILIQKKLKVPSTNEKSKDAHSKEEKL